MRNLIVLSAVILLMIISCGKSNPVVPDLCLRGTFGLGSQVLPPLSCTQEAADEYCLSFSGLFIRAENFGCDEQGNEKISWITCTDCVILLE